MIQIEDMQLAAALLREPSLSAAARALDVTPPALSMRLRKLEATLGLSLASRTARRLSLTSKRLTGTLRIAAPFGYGRQYVAPMLARFARLHPGLRVQLDLRETPWPDRHDADAVIHIGAVRDSSWVARTLSANERWLCASPAYLRRHGEPRTPRDVLTHACICIRENDEDVTLWHVRPAADAANAAEGKRAAARETLRVSPAYVTNDGGVARQWAEQGMGLVLRSEWDAADAVARGTLVRVLPGWRFDSAPVTLLVPTRKGRTARVAAIVDFLVESFGSGAR